MNLLLYHLTIPSIHHQMNFPLYRILRYPVH